MSKVILRGVAVAASLLSFAILPFSAADLPLVAPGGVGGSGESSRVELAGAAYEIHGSSVVLTAACVRNNGGGRSGTLRLELWATTAGYSGTGSFSGYYVAQYRLDPLPDNSSYSSVSSGPVSYTQPPTGTWRLVMLLNEYTGSPHGDGFVLRDHANLDRPLVVGSGFGPDVPTAGVGLSVAPNLSGRVINFSIRSVVGAADQTLVLGCFVGGSGTKSLLVRGVGPTLAGFNVGNVLGDPLLQIYAGSVLRMSNDNWGQAPNVTAITQAFSRLGAFNLPSGSRDAVVLDNFAQGGWTMQVSGPAGGGVALVEVYDADSNQTTASARLANLSARAMVGSGECALFAGFVVSGGSRKVLIRVVGGTLRAFNVSGALEDPVLRLYRGSTLVAECDDVDNSPDRAQIDAVARAVSAFNLISPLDSAVLVTLAPGAYSAEVSGYDGVTGIGLLEIYEVP